MNFRGMAIAMTIGLVISASCTYVLSRMITAHGAERAQEQKYVAPAKALKAGETLKADNIELVSWPATTPISDAFTQTRGGDWPRSSLSHWQGSADYGTVSYGSRLRHWIGRQDPGWHARR